MILILLFNLVYVLLLLSFAIAFSRAEEPSVAPKDLPFVSVVVPVRNEEVNVSPLIRSLQWQTYPAEKTEWIFVDDHSEDDTVLLLSAVKDSRIRLFRQGDDASGKKAALTKGINEASGKWILTTDADCVLSDAWVFSLVAKAESSGATMVCGMVEIENTCGWRNAVQSMETGVLQVSGAGSLSLNHPLLNTGTSLCFSKEKWQEIGGYTSNSHIASGDDTFLMLSFHHQDPGKVLPLVQKEAIAVTKPAESWKEMLLQRIRWNDKVKHYPAGAIYITGIIVVGSGIGWIASLFIPAFGLPPLVLFTTVFLLRLLTETAVLQVWKKVAQQSFSPIAIVGMSVFYPFFTLFSFIIRPFMKTAWKGRKV